MKSEVGSRKSEVLTLTHDELLAAVAEVIAKRLTPERIEEMAEAEIAARIGLLTLPQAMQALQCANERQLVDFCRQQRVPIVYFTHQKRFIRIAEIEAAIARRAMTAGEGGTRVVAIRDERSGIRDQRQPEAQRAA